ncbi:response regulator [Nitrospirota bacterium]
MTNKLTDILKWSLIVFSGAAVLIVIATLQKIIAGDVLVFKGYIAPVLLGSSFSILIKIWHLRLNTHKNHLEKLIKVRTDALLESNERLKNEIDKRESIDQQSRQLLRDFESLFHSMPVGIMCIDKDYQILDINNKFCDLFSMQRDDLLGKICYEMFGHDVIESNINNKPGVCPFCNIVQCMKSKKISSFDRVVGDNHLKVTTVPEINEQGEVTRFFEILDDVSRRRHYEMDLKAAKEEAETANQAKGDFLAHMSHEIRTPMNAIIGMTDLCFMEESGEDQTEYIGHIREASYSLVRILNDILDMSKIRSGKLEIDNIPFELNMVISSVIGTFKSSAVAKGLKLESTLTPDLPENLIGDPLRIKQVLSNLISNAIKFTKEGSVTISVNKDASDVIRFSVTDTGIGIPVEKELDIFHEFTQVDISTTRKYGGTGLGLSISKNIIELMGGSLRLNSTSSEGSQFEFQLELQNAESVNKDFPSKKNKNDECHLCNLNVLVAEDNKLNQTLITRLLEKRGCHVVIADNGKTALDILSTQKFDIIFMDIQMPEMDGYETVHRIRQDEINKDTPIIAMTAHAMTGDEEKCIASGMNHYIAKPIEVKKVFDIVTQYCKN